MAKTKKEETLYMIMAALFTALMAVFAQIPPSTHEFPVTLQTFAIALCGYTLTLKYSLFSIVAYILLGAVGAPVFSGLCGGLHHVTGPAGGFIIAFPLFVLFCALSQRFKSSIIGIGLGVIGLLVLYIVGLTYFIFITHNPIWTAIIMYVPVFIKDIFSLISAFYFSKLLSKRITKKSAQ